MYSKSLVQSRQRESTIRQLSDLFRVSITYDRAQGTRCKHPSTHDQKDF